MSTIFDSHCHPQFPQYDKDREEMLARAKSAGMSMICVGTDLETSKQGIALAEKQDNIWATVGIHPNDIFNDIFEECFINSSYDRFIKHSKVVAIGEAGLDYYRTTETQKQRKQKEVFEQFISLAIKHNKPLILHSRDAGKGSAGKVHKDMIEIIIKSGLCSLHDRDINVNKRLGVMHSFTGDVNDAKKYLNLGFYLSFNGIITFARQYDEVVRYVPLENILLETDAPFLAPEPYRGQRNEPAYVIEVAKKIAELKNEPLEKVIEQTTKNCRKLFNI